MKWLCILFLFVCASSNLSASSEFSEISKSFSNVSQQMSSFILNRRMDRLAKVNHHDLNSEPWKVRIQRDDILTVVPSKKIKEFGNIVFAVNYTALLKKFQPFGTHFDLYLKDKPDQFLIEGFYSVGGILFEDELCVKDIEGGQDFTFEIIKNECFPNEIIEAMVDDDEDYNFDPDNQFTDQIKASKDLTELKRLLTDRYSQLSGALVYSYKWMPVLDPIMIGTEQDKSDSDEEGPLTKKRKGS